MNRYIPLMLLIAMLSCTGERKKNDENTREKPTVAVVNYPLYYFAKTIAGEHIDVYLPDIDGDPAYWQLNADQIMKYQQADLILANGAGYASWMEKVSLPSSKIVVTSSEFKDQWIELDEGVTHSHGPEGEHVHKGTAFTTWLNFEFALMHAETVYHSILKLLPENEQTLSANYQKLKQELEALDVEMKEIAQRLGTNYIIASHPVYQYLEEAYGLKLISLHWEPDEMPDDEQWKSMEKTVKEHQVELMIWEDEPLPEIRTRLEKMGIRITVFNPCGNRSASGDFMEVMRGNIENLRSVSQ